MSLDKLDIEQIEEMPEEQFFESLFKKWFIQIDSETLVKSFCPPNGVNVDEIRKVNSVDEIRKMFREKYSQVKDWYEFNDDPNFRINEYFDNQLNGFMYLKNGDIKMNNHLLNFEINDIDELKEFIIDDFKQNNDYSIDWNHPMNKVSLSYWSKMLGSDLNYFNDLDDYLDEDSKLEM